MTKTSFVLAAGMVAILMAAPALAAPLKDEIDNGSFETWTDDGPVSWDVVAGSVSPSSHAADGATSASLQAPSDGVLAGIAQVVPNDSDDLPTIIPGAYYEFDFSAHLNTGSGSSAQANAVVVWRDILGNEVDRDTITLADSQTFETHSLVLQAPLPDPGELPVQNALVSFFMQLPSANSRHDVLLFVDAVAFGPTTPPLPA